MDKKILYGALGVLIVAVSIIGCAGLQEKLTPEQRLYYILLDYKTVATAAADYCEAPEADANIKKAIKTTAKEIDRFVEYVETGVYTYNEAIPIIQSLLDQFKKFLVVHERGDK